MAGAEDKLSRRDVLTGGLAAGAVLAAAPDSAASAGTAPASSPGAVAGRRFRGWVSRGTGAGRTTLQTLTMRAIGGRQVVVRTEATNLCYTLTSAVLGLAPLRANAAAPAPPASPARVAAAQQLQRMAIIQGHGGVGIVEAVGPEVRRVRIGDRVVVSSTPQCGSCYQCLRGRADMCQVLTHQGPHDLVPIADLQDGTPVYGNSNIGGLSEMMVTFEEWLVPVFSRASAVELCMVTSCVGIAGLGCTASQALAAVGPGSSVAVLGAGPLGLSAVQGARISGASMIIAIEPIRIRRDLALKVGATHVLDPNVEGLGLVDRVRELTRGPTENLWAGGKQWGDVFHGGTGADFVVEAVGADRIEPGLEHGPDPTGLLPLRQAYEMCAPGGNIVTTGLPEGMLTLPAVDFCIGGRTHHAGQCGGASPMRDLPRFVAMLDRGQYDASSLATTVIGIDAMMDAYRQVAARTTVTAIMTA